MKKLKLHELGRKTPEAYRRTEKISLCLVLDNIRSLHNVGAAFRTADAFLVERIYLCGITGCPPHRDIHKTALGAQDVVAWEYSRDATAIVHRLEKEGYTVIAAEHTDRSIPVQDYEVQTGNSYALVFGNEVEGVSSEVIDACHEIVEIPQFGTKHSFNVSVAMGIILWEFGRKLLPLSSPTR